jgi:hypothetical protein
MNRKEAEKAARERGVFHDFIKKKPGSPINPESVESRCTPEPDILCFQENEGNVAFELVEICDPDIARIIAKGGGSLWTSDPTQNEIRKKLKKNYQTEYPVELLCYTDGKTVSWDQLIKEEIWRLIDMVGNGQFRRIWLLGDQCHLVFEAPS